MYIPVNVFQCPLCHLLCGFEFSKLLPIVTEVQTPQVPAKKAKTSSQSCLADVAETIPEPINGTPEGATEEIGKYFTELSVSEDKNPNVWWKNIE